MQVCRMEMKSEVGAVTPGMDVAVGDDYRHPRHPTLYSTRCKSIATLCSRCKTIATLDLYFENRSVIFNVSSGYCQPCLILYHLHRSPQSATLDHTISFLAFTELHTLNCAHQPA